MAVPAPAPEWVIAVNLGLLVLSLWLLKRGWWPRRSGDAPYCRKCNYNLRGVAGDACPECGADRTRRPPRIGERRRRHRTGALGTLLLLLVLAQAGVAVVIAARGTNLYPYLPASIVAAWLDRPSQAQNAWKEFERRKQAMALDPDDHAAWRAASLRGVLAQAGGASTPLYSVKLAHVAAAAGAGAIPFPQWRELARVGMAFQLGPPGNDRMMWLTIVTQALRHNVLADDQRTEITATCLGALAGRAARWLQPVEAFGVLAVGYEVEGLTSAERRAFLDLMYELYGNGLMTATVNPFLASHIESLELADRSRLFARMLVPSLRVRPDNTVGKTIRAAYSAEWVGPGEFGYGVAARRFTIDGAPAGDELFSAGSHDAGVARLPPAAPGTHRAEVEVRYVVSRRQPVYRSGASGKAEVLQDAGDLGECVVRSVATFRVRTVEEGDEVVPVTDAATSSRMRAVVRVQAAEWAEGEQYRVPSRGRTRPPGLMIILDTDPIAVPLAFEVFAEVGQQRYALTPFVALPGSLWAFSYGTGVPPVDRVNLVLRPSPDTARDTLDVVRIWGEELRFEDVRVRLPPELRDREESPAPPR